MEGTVLLKRACGHSSPFTYKKNERLRKATAAKLSGQEVPGMHDRRDSGSRGEAKGGSRAEETH